MPVTQVNNRLIKDAAVTGVKLNVLTTKGDLMVYDTVADREAIGSDGQVLIADSSQTTGVRWGVNVATAIQSLSTDPGSPTEGTVWYNTTTGTEKIASQYGSLPLVGSLFTSGTTSTAVTNTTSETNINIATAMPANSLVVGSTFRVKCMGVITATGTPTIDLRVRLGTTGAILDVGTLTAVTGTKRWMLEVTAVVISTGTSATVTGAGWILIGDGNIYPTTALTVAFNSTIAQSLRATAQWGTAAAGNTLQQEVMTVEILS